MSHLIKEYDLTLSVSSSEWHGLAIMPQGETDEEKRVEIIKMTRENITFPIVQGDALARFVRENGESETVPLLDETEKGWKIILADCAEMPRHEGREVHPPALVPLHVPKNGYEPLANGRFFDIAEKAFSDLGLKFDVSTAGTLGNLKRFYFSVSMAEFNAKTPDGNKIDSFLSFMTSHDGSLCPTVKDSHIRVVCNNTFTAVMRSLANFELTGKHTAGGLASLDNLGNALELFQNGQKELETEIFPRLRETALDNEAMREIVAGYFFSETIANGGKIPEKVTLTTQAFNATEEIVSLARSGKGNAGETAFDLWNGATDYWSNGSGVGGEKVGLSKRASRSHFGQAAEHKTAFSAYLFNEETVALCRPIGAKALTNYALAKA